MTDHQISLDEAVASLRESHDGILANVIGPGADADVGMSISASWTDPTGGGHVYLSYSTYDPDDDAFENDDEGGDDD